MSVVEFCELTEKLATPFLAWIFTGDGEPLILAVESLDKSVIVKSSLTGARFTLQSLMLTISVIEPVLVVIGGFG